MIIFSEKGTVNNNYNYSFLTEDLMKKELEELKEQSESLNDSIYSDLNLEELEERLEMSKVAGLYACGCNTEIANTHRLQVNILFDGKYMFCCINLIILLRIHIIYIPHFCNCSKN